MKATDILCPIEIILWNSSGLKNIDDIRNIINCRSIIGLLETWCPSKPNWTLTSTLEYAQETIYSPAEKTEERGRAKGGIADSYNSNVFKVRILFISRYYVFSLIIKDNFQFILGSVYVSPLENLEVVLISLKDELISIMQTFVDSPIIIVGI